ncbi:hypothetical protein ACOMHN_052448 [Nucella lapillus]
MPLAVRASLQLLKLSRRRRQGREADSRHLATSKGIYSLVLLALAADRADTSAKASKQMIVIQNHHRGLVCDKAHTSGLGRRGSPGDSLPLANFLATVFAPVRLRWRTRPLVAAGLSAHCLSPN